ncbi:MAG: acetyl-CoA carboxylase biotin carboxylase subunit family protein [Planctomycetota bacterium]
MSSAPKNLLVLYPGAVSFRQREFARQRALLREAGLHTILADDYLAESDADVFDERLLLPPPEHVEEAWRRIERAFATRRVDAVLAQSEGALLIGALACARWGVPGVPARAALWCTSKFLCRRELEHAGVPVPQFTLASSAAEARRFACEHGFPVVLKGVASALGRLVTLVRDESELDLAVQRVRHGLQSSADIQRLEEFARIAGFELDCDPRRQFLVESFARGAPVETDGLVVGATPHSFGVTGQVLSTPPRFFLEGYRLPDDRPPRELEEIERVSNAAIETLGLRDTGFSIEMRHTPAATSVIEVNGRLGSDEGFGDLFEAVLGAQPLALALELARGLEPRIAPRTDVHAALAYATCYEDRVVASVPSDVELSAAATDGVTLGLAARVGERYYAPPHPDVTPHLAFGLARDPHSSARAYSRARAAVDRLRFELALPDALARTAR